MPVPDTEIVRRDSPKTGPSVKDPLGRYEH